MTAITNSSQVQLITTELNDLLQNFDTSKNNAALTTQSGKVYKVANVLKFKGEWEVTELHSRGVFECMNCPEDEDEIFYCGKVFFEDDWYQISRNDQVIRLHSKDIHTLREHPNKVTDETIKKLAAVFLD